MPTADRPRVKEFALIAGPLTLGVTTDHPLAAALPLPSAIVSPLPVPPTMPTPSVCQGGAIPFRETPDGRVEICLVTSSSGLWSLPKGGIDPGRSAPQTAMIESFEEAGLIGTIVDDALGVWRYEKRGRVRHVAFFPMRVEHEIDDWDEMDRRHRRWVDASTAHHHLQRPGLETAIHAFQRWLNSAAV